jgi:ABC-2 type transport system ATP-binding protein
VTTGRPAAVQPAIDVRALSKFHGTIAALHDVSFAVDAGELVFIAGPAGSGKTTILKLLTGQMTPTGGRVRIHGLDLRTDRLGVTERIGYLAQTPVDCGDLPPLELFEYSGRARRLPEQRLRDAVTRVTATCDIASLLDTPWNRMTADERQQVLLAQVLLHEPDVLLLDEFLTEATPLATIARVSLLRALTRQATIVVTGSPSLAGVFAADRVLLLEEGRLASRDRAAGTA